MVPDNKQREVQERAPPSSGAEDEPHQHSQLHGSRRRCCHATSCGALQRNQPGSLQKRNIWWFSEVCCWTGIWPQWITSCGQFQALVITTYHKGKMGNDSIWNELSNMCHSKLLYKKSKQQHQAANSSQATNTARLVWNPYIWVSNNAYKQRSYRLKGPLFIVALFIYRCHRCKQKCKACKFAVCLILDNAELIFEMEFHHKAIDVKFLISIS